MPETMEHLLGYTLYLACDTKEVVSPTGACPISFITERGRLVRIVRSWDTNSPTDIVECTPMRSAAGLACVLWPSVAQSSRVMTTTIELLRAGVRAHDTSLMLACPEPLPVRLGDSHVVPVVVSSIDGDSLVIYAAHICGVRVTLHGVTRVRCEEWVLPEPQKLFEALCEGGEQRREPTSDATPARSYIRPPQAKPRAPQKRHLSETRGPLGAARKQRGRYCV